MPGILRHSTGAYLVIGPFISDSDFKTPQTALALAVGDIMISKGGSYPYATKNDTDVPGNFGNGMYAVHFNATDTNIIGNLYLMVQKAGALPVWDTFSVIPAAVYDALWTYADPFQYLGVSVQQWGGTTVFADTPGHPKVTIKDGTGQGEIALTGGAVDTVSALGATAQSQVKSNVLQAVTGDLLTNRILPSDQAGTAQAGTTTSITLAATAGSYDLKGAIVRLLTGTGAGQSRTIDAYDSTTKIATVHGTTPWSPAPASDTTYVIVHSDISATQHRGQIIQALTVDTYPEPGQAAPPATLSIVGRLQYLFKAWRNRITQNDTEYKMFNDAGTVVDQKSTLSESAGTYDRGKIGSGP